MTGGWTTRAANGIMERPSWAEVLRDGAEGIRDSVRRTVPHQCAGTCLEIEERAKRQRDTGRDLRPRERGRAGRTSGGQTKTDEQQRRSEEQTEQQRRRGEQRARRRRAPTGRQARGRRRDFTPLGGFLVVLRCASDATFWLAHPQRTAWLSAALNAPCWLRMPASCSPARRRRVCHRSTSAIDNCAIEISAILSCLIERTRLCWSRADDCAHVSRF